MSDCSSDVCSSDLTDYQQPRYGQPAFILVGNEQAGLPPEYEAACDVLVKMPMLGKADSLHAAVATAVMAYEVLNQRRSVVSRYLTSSSQFALEPPENWRKSPVCLNSSAYPRVGKEWGSKCKTR